MSKLYEEKELKILRSAIDNATFIIGKKLVQSDSIKNIIEILETFMRTHKILCYGGTAINISTRSFFLRRHHYFGGCWEPPHFFYGNHHYLQTTNKFHVPEPPHK